MQPLNEMQCWQPEPHYDRPLHYRMIFRALPPRPFAALAAIEPRQYSRTVTLLAIVILGVWRFMTRPRFSLGLLLAAGALACYLATFLLRSWP